MSCEVDARDRTQGLLNTSKRSSELYLYSTLSFDFVFVFIFVF